MNSEIPGFELISPLGAGGFGAVWLARQLSVDRDVAIKVGHHRLTDDVARVRFERECRALGRLSGNSNIVAVHVAGTLDDGRPYLVLEYIGGGTLWSLVNERAVTPEELATIGRQVCNALKHAHDLEILHRDIKPENVLLRPDGSAVLGDFGIAVLRDGAATAAAITASIPFAAPEILSGQPATTASDLYGVGATILAGATRRVPFSEPTDEGIHPVVNRVLTTNPIDLRTIGYPDDLASTVERLMSRDPARRPESAAEAEAMFEALSPAGSLVEPAPARSTRLVAYTPSPSPAAPPITGSTTPPLPPGSFSAPTPAHGGSATPHGIEPPQNHNPQRLLTLIGVLIVVSFLGGGLVWLLNQTGEARAETFRAESVAAPSSVTSSPQGPAVEPTPPTSTVAIVDSTTTTPLGPLSLPLTAEDAGLPSDSDVTEVPDQAGMGFCNRMIDTAGLEEEQNSLVNHFDGNEQMTQSAVRFDSEANATAYLLALANSLDCSSSEDVTVDNSGTYTIRSIAIEPVRLFGDETKAWESTVVFENGFEVVQRSYAVRRADRIIGLSFTTDERPKLERLPDLVALMVERLGY